LLVVLLREQFTRLEAQARMVRYRRNLRRQGSSMENISDALLIVRPVVKVYVDAHGMFAVALITRNVNRILRHGNSFPPLFTTVGECSIKNLSVSQMAGTCAMSCRNLGAGVGNDQKPLKNLDVSGDLIEGEFSSILAFKRFALELHSA
jgi:hypothetical protein